MSTEPFGFVGLGAMGGPMIEKAIEAGLTVHVFDANQAALNSAANLGAKIEKSAAGVASATEVVFVSLPNAPIVEAVALGPDGVIEGTCIKHYIDLSTTGPTVAMKVGQAFQERGISALDCPVSGGPVGVKNKTLAVMSGGPKETLDRATPFLRSFTKTFVHVGPEVGKAQIVKLANNILMATNMLIVAEAMAFAEKGGVDPKDLFEVVNNGSGRSWVSEIAYPKHVLAINLRRLRHAKQMTQEDLAERTGLSDRYVGAIERVDVSASVTVLGRLADGLNVDAADLVQRTRSRVSRA